jgi:flagellar motility protein MotE (MotC chaperone)
MQCRCSGIAQAPGPSALQRPNKYAAAGSQRSTAPRGRSGRRRRRISILLALCVVFAFSAALRIGQLGNPFEAQPANAFDANATATGFAGPTAPIRSALDEVERLRAELATREVEIAARERAVDAAQVLIEERIAVLSATEERLTSLMALSDTAAETDIDRLTRVYETMEPDAAAPLFAQMEPSFAAGFLSRMSPAASAALMSELEPQTAYAISVVLATRNAAAPTRETAAGTPAETGN